MIQITVTDPAKTSRAELAITIAVLQAFHSGERAVNELAERLAGVHRASAPSLPPVAFDGVRDAAGDLIDPNDSPDVGRDIPNPNAAFGNAGAAVAFGDAGNVQGAGSPAITDPNIAFSPPAAPSAPPAAVAPAPAGVDLDADGLPWDNRIHASTKSKNQDGRWKAKRGVDGGVVAQVQAELRGVMAAPAAAPVGNVAPPPPAPTGAPATPPAPQPIPTPPAPPAGIAAPAPVITPAAPAGVDFPTLAKMVGELIPAGRLTNEKLTEIVNRHGLPGFGLLFNRPDLVPAVHAEILAGVQG